MWNDIWLQSVPSNDISSTRAMLPLVGDLQFITVTAWCLSAATAASAMFYLLINLTNTCISLIYHFRTGSHGQINSFGLTGLGSCPVSTFFLVHRYIAKSRFSHHQAKSEKR